MTTTNTISAADAARRDEDLQYLSQRSWSTWDTIQDLSSYMLSAYLLDGGRAVRIGKHLYVIYQGFVKQTYEIDELLDFLHDRLCDCTPELLMKIILAFAVDSLYLRAPQLEELLTQAGEDPASWLQNCSTQADEIAVIERVNQTYGTNFFALLEEERDYDEELEAWESD